MLTSYSKDVPAPLRSIMNFLKHLFCGHSTNTAAFYRDIWDRQIGDLQASIPVLLYQESILRETGPTKLALNGEMLA